MCDYEERAECNSQREKEEKKDLEPWMEICDKCERGDILTTSEGKPYGVWCGLNKGMNWRGYEIYLESEIPKKCPHREKEEGK